MIFCEIKSGQMQVYFPTKTVGYLKWANLKVGYNCSNQQTLFTLKFECKLMFDRKYGK